MRLSGRGALALVLAIGLTGCIENNNVDPVDSAKNAALGAVWGGALGAGLGATFAINPAIGATMGAATGAFIGLTAAAMWSQPAVSYAPITPPAQAVIPGYYDGWAPGSHPPPLRVMAPPPRAAGAG